jgi:hypothetical protein
MRAPWMKMELLAFNFFSDFFFSFTGAVFAILLVQR